MPEESRGDALRYIQDRTIARAIEQVSTHRFVTGKLVHVGKMKPEIKMQTDDGEKVFPLLHQETKTKPLPDGTITVELNEAGFVIDLHRADNIGKNK